MRLRVLDGGVDKYGLNAYIFDSTERRTRPTTTRSCSRRRRAPRDSVGTLAKGQWADVKVKISGGTLDGRPRACWSRSRSWHGRPVAGFGCSTRRSRRAIASVADLEGRAGLHRRLRRVPGPEVPDLDGGRLRHPRSRRDQRGDLRPAGPVLVDRPHADASIRREDVQARPPDGRASRRPTSSSTSSSGSSRRSCPAAPRTPPTTTSTSTAWPTAASRPVRASSRTAYREADKTLTLARSLVGQGPDHLRRLRPRLRAAVPRDRRQPAARRPRPALASRRPRTAGTATGETRADWPSPAGPAERSRST